MRIRKQSPIISLLDSMNQSGHLVFTKVGSFKLEYIHHSLDLMFCEMQPSVIIGVGSKDNWHIYSGSHFIHGILQYINAGIVYPADGAVEVLRGKSFAQLPRMTQRSILQFDVSAMVCDLGREPECDAEFFRLAELSEKLS